MKLHIFGASASGVTTLGQALSRHLNCPYFDSDDYFWHQTEPPFTVRRQATERNALLRRDLENTTDWIVGGSIINWGDNVFPPFDLIVFLYLPADIRLRRLKQREVDRYGSAIYTDPQRRQLFNDFVAWAADYDTDTGLANRTLRAHETWLLKTKSPVLKIMGDTTVEARIHLVTQRLASFDEQ